MVTRFVCGLEGISLHRQYRHRRRQGRGSIFDSTGRLRKRASQLILEIPAAQLKKIKETEGIGSVDRESKHFCGQCSAKVSFRMKEHGIDFPVVTLCNFNPVKKSYIKRQKALEAYQADHPDFKVPDFFMEAGLNLQNSGKDWMKKQVEAGVTSGLQMVLDAHLEEQFDGTGGDPEPIFSDAFENGFRYYVHTPGAIPYLTSEGISVSPTARVYSAISTSTVRLKEVGCSNFDVAALT
ncbi:hypothetical protein TELCIR_01872 [Teladorsagia circumcincta]|uniref:Uncharacterized protein n=1 Tax=Teladorsagia circumcincta TaxID=45464 RepID=A0A2G9V0R1_TELCI|nr:hypothetical protein TELCIR_01872 [Teladorsagia circumcincta]